MARLSMSLFTAKKFMAPALYFANHNAIFLWHTWYFMADAVLALSYDLQSQAHNSSIDTWTFAVILSRTLYTAST